MKSIPASAIICSATRPGKDGELALLGVDGIVVAGELDITPQPTSEWEAVLTTDEGRVFHRLGTPFARVRSITSIDSRPGEQFATATVSRIDDSPKSGGRRCPCPQRRSSGSDHFFQAVFSRIRSAARQSKTSRHVVSRIVSNCRSPSWRSWTPRSHLSTSLVHFGKRNRSGLRLCIPASMHVKRATRQLTFFCPLCGIATQSRG